jgi:hypothetical protein
MLHLSVTRCNAKENPVADYEAQITTTVSGAGATLAYEARRLFDQLRYGARLRRLWGVLRGRSSALPSGETLLTGTVAAPSKSATVQHIDLDRIVGSEGRAHEFDATFAPLQEHTRERWLRVAHAWMHGLQLPPVRLIQVGDQYIVRDGHHRISVARAFQATTIDAVVEQRFVQVAQPASRAIHQAGQWARA